MRHMFKHVLVLGLASTACHASPADRGSSPKSGTAANNAAGVPAVAAQPIRLVAADGLSIHGLYFAADRPKAIVLLFHQAGSNKAEYSTIAPQLAAAGYDALAIDQRSGGSMFGNTNRTAAAFAGQASFSDAVQDLRAALAWAADRNLPVILWGSSYSSSLVLQLASEQPEKVAAVLAFSPGEYFGDGHPVRRWATGVTAPLFITSAKEAGEIAEAKALLDAAPSSSKQQFVPERGGVHGSSTLIKSRNASGAEENWKAVLAFLEAVLP